MRFNGGYATKVFAMVYGKKKTSIRRNCSGERKSGDEKTDDSVIATNQLQSY